MTPFGCSTVTRPPVEPKRTQALPEDRLGAAMLELARAGGHRKRHPQAVNKPHFVEAQKIGRMLGLLRQRPYSISDLVNLFGNKPIVHSLILQLRTKGYDIACEWKGKGTRYRLISEPEQ